MKCLWSGSKRRVSTAVPLGDAPSSPAAGGEIQAFGATAGAGAVEASSSPPSAEHQSIELFLLPTGSGIVKPHVPPSASPGRQLLRICRPQRDWYQRYASTAIAHTAKPISVYCFSRRDDSAAAWLTPK